LLGDDRRNFMLDPWLGLFKLGTPDAERKVFPLSGKDQVDHFSHRALSTLLAADVGHASGDGWDGIGRSGRKSDGLKDFEVIDVVTHIGRLGHRETMTPQQIAEHGELVVSGLMDFGDGELFPSALDEFRLFFGDECRQDPGRLQQLDAHPVPGVEFLQLIAGFSVVHARVGQDPIHVQRNQADPFENRP
jgi:hypothetical protein